jgi:O-antigen/teichoic acid export membrane protein
VESASKPASPSASGSAIANVASQLATLGVWFFLTPFLLRRLGTEVFGLWAIVTVLTANAYLLDVGISNALTRDVAASRASGDIDGGGASFAAAVRLLAGLGALVLVVGAPVALLAPTLFDPQHAGGADTRAAFALGAATVALSLPARATSAALEGLQRFDVTAAIAGLALVLQAAGTVAVLALGGGAVAVLAVPLPMILVSQGIALAVLWRLEPRMRVRGRRPDRSPIRRMAGFGSWVFVSNLAGHAQTRLDELIVGALVGLQAVTPFTLARRVAELPQSVAAKFLQVLLPIVSAGAATGDRAQVARIFVVGTRATVALSAVTGLVFLVLRRPFFDGWIGHSHHPGGWLLAAVIAAVAIDLSMWPAGVVLQGLGLPRRLALFAAGSAAVNVTLSIVLAAALGTAGVAVATIIAASIECALFVMPYALSVLRLPARTLLGRAIAPALAPLLPAAAVLAALGPLVRDHGLGGFVAGAAPAGLAFLAAYLMLPPCEDERRVLRSLERRLRVAVAVSRLSRSGPSAGSATASPWGGPPSSADG